MSHGSSGLSLDWACPVSTLDLPIATDPPVDLMVEFRIICTERIPADVLDSLTMKVNGHPIPLNILLSDQGTRFLQGLIPPSILKNTPFTEFSFQVDRVTSLKEINPADPDTRQVGLAFNYVQVFPVQSRQQHSALSHFLDCETWQNAIAFLNAHVSSSESIVAPLILNIQLDHELHDHSTFLAGDPTSQWVVIHKGRTDRVGAILFKLMSQGFSPVFANEVFVVYSRRSDLPTVSYTSPHVKPLYVDYLKRNVFGAALSFYRKHISQRPQVSKVVKPLIKK
ncbi:hypothetical protein [Egbenema bharatensis]|uniref:hypothetical protein n=1 Tax=Egbenema bharatensis TaxID=3463334 RepID=UPI003A8BD2EA